MSNRRLRLESALKCKIQPKMPLGLPLANETSFEECKQKHKSSMETLNEMREMKFQVLENWEQTKRNAIEKLAAEIEDLQMIEEQIEKREQELQNRGIRLSDVGFKRFCADSMSAVAMNLSTPPARKSTSNDIRQMPSMKKAKLQSQQNQTNVEHKTPIQVKKVETMQEVGNTKLDLPNEGDDMVVIGPNGTKVSKAALHSINWLSSGAAVTRKILMEVFDRETLAFHTLTGKPSPAFIDCDKPMKHQLDPNKVADIIHIVTRNLPMTAKDVRSAITTKCADENKMFRQREKKRLSLEANNKENQNMRMSLIL